MKLIYKTAMVSLFAMTACGGGSDDSPEVIVPEVTLIAEPKATTLVFPENNTECNEGDIVNDLTSNVIFRWNVAEDTDSYEVTLRNLNSNTSINFNSINTQSLVTLDRGTPYEWFVISKATGTTATATSSTFKFYNQGPGIENYAPFPAEVVQPMRGESIPTTTTVTLEWTGSDIDNDITGYELFFGTDAEPSQSIGTTAAEAFETTVSPGETYYWRVVSSDSAENTSQSEIFEFKVSS